MTPFISKKSICSWVTSGPKIKSGHSSFFIQKLLAKSLFKF
jgi:hypothetical protein